MIEGRRKAEGRRKVGGPVRRASVDAERRGGGMWVILGEEVRWCRKGDQKAARGYARVGCVEEMGSIGKVQSGPAVDEGRSGDRGRCSC